MYICKTFASFYLESRILRKRSSCARAPSGNLLGKLENCWKDLNASIQDIRTKFSQGVPTRNSDVESLKQEIAHLEEVVWAIQENIIKKLVNQKSSEPENRALDETTERRARVTGMKSQMSV